MERKELLGKLKAVNAKISEIESAEPVVYATACKFIPKAGYVHELESKRDCAKALAIVKENFSVETSAAEELGLSFDDIKEDTNFLGFKLDVWKSDIQKRVAELTQLETLEKLEVAKEKLMKHRSAEDIFNEDMDSIGDVLEGL
jgi:hypothetical protein